MLIILGSTCFFCIIYSIYSFHLDFPTKVILKEFANIAKDKSLLILVRLSVEKVNGWNRMTMFYTILHYVLNIWSITFSCMSIFYSFISQNTLSIFSSIIAILSVTCNLFLRCDRKWGVFRKVLAYGRKETNSFISGYATSQSLNKFTNNYAQKIIEIESSLENSDIT